MTLFACLLLFNLLVFGFAHFERNALAHPAAVITLLVTFGVAAALARRRATAQVRSQTAQLRFEEAPEPAVFALKIYQDGATPLRHAD